MIQQPTQQMWCYQFRPSTSPEPARGAEPTISRHLPRSRIRPHLSPPLLTLLATGLTASLLALAMLYVSAHALAAKGEYLRQRLLRETALRRAQNLALRCQLSESTDFARISQIALAAGMRPANPATDTDFISLPLAAKEQAHAEAGLSQKASPLPWFNQGPPLIAALVRQLSLSFATGRAEASPPLRITISKPANLAGGKSPPRPCRVE